MEKVLAGGHYILGANVAALEQDIAACFPVAEAVSKTILPLPIYPELTDDQADYVIEMVSKFSF